jgi:threonine dehydrogenase-like Zn-dependent dehydrogenase
MKAVWFEDRHVTVREVEPPPLAPGYARVRVRLAGICRTDVELLRGYLGFRGTPGHEFVGTVAEGPAEWVGRRVVAEINFGCGRCLWCHTGLARHCPQRAVLGIQGAPGALAEFTDVPVRNLHALPEGVSDEEAVFVEPLAAAFEIAEQLHLPPGTEALVLGDGKLGLLVARVLHLQGLRVHLVGKHEHKLALARASGCAATAVEDFVPRPYPLVVEATGRSDGLPLALMCLRPRGTIVLKSTVADRSTLDLAPLVIHEVQVVGSRCGPFPPAIEALARGWISASDLIAARFPLARIGEAMELAQRPGVLKVLVEP